MSDITVPVPEARTAEFYQFFGLWLAGSLSLPGGIPVGAESPSETSQMPTPHQPWGDTKSDVNDAALLWEKYSPRARAMFSLLVDNPGKEFTGEQIADAANIPNGARRGRGPRLARPSRLRDRPGAAHVVARGPRDVREPHRGRGTARRE